MRLFHSGDWSKASIAASVASSKAGDMSQSSIAARVDSFKAGDSNAMRSIRLSNLT